MEEFTGCGHNILGPIYLVVFITMGAFIFANLVVAVVVTNLVMIVNLCITSRFSFVLQEWVIEQKNERVKKFTNKQDVTDLPSSAYEDLFNIVPSQIPRVVHH